MFKFFIKHFIVTKLKIPKFIKLTMVEENTSLLDTYTPWYVNVHNDVCTYTVTKSQIKYFLRVQIKDPLSNSGLMVSLLSFTTQP